MRQSSNEMIARSLGQKFKTTLKKHVIWMYWFLGIKWNYEEFNALYCRKSCFYLLKSALSYTMLCSSHISIWYCSSFDPFCSDRQQCTLLDLHGALFYPWGQFALCFLKYRMVIQFTTDITGYKRTKWPQRYTVWKS